MAASLPYLAHPGWNSAPDFGRRETILDTLHRLHQLDCKSPVIVEIGTSRDERPEACSGDGWSTRAWAWYATQTGGKAYTVDSDAEAIEACRRITGFEGRGTTREGRGSRSEGRALQLIGVCEEQGPVPVDSDDSYVDGAGCGSIEFIVGDGIEVLRRWNSHECGPIDLLYLDGLDYNSVNAESGESGRAGSEQFHLTAAESALPHLSGRCLVLIDDTYPSEEIGLRTEERAPSTERQAPRTEDRPERGAQCRMCTGKGAAVVPYLQSKGFKIEWTAGGQVLLSRGAEETVPETGIQDGAMQGITDRLRAYARRSWLAAPPLCVVGQAYRQFEQSAEAQVYLGAVARRCRHGEGSGPMGGNGGNSAFNTGNGEGRISALEINPASSFAQAFLAQRGIPAVGMMLDPDLLERALQTAHWLDTDTAYASADLFSRCLSGEKYRLIHHSDVASALPTRWLTALLARQVTVADWVVFAVDSVYADHNSEFEACDTRRMTPEMWQEILADFDIAEMQTYGPTGKERILITLRGQPSSPLLKRLMAVGPEPYPFGVSVIIHTHNEAHQISDCIQSTRGLADEVIVCDMESNDGTIEVANRVAGVRIIRHPKIPNFDDSRNASAMFARYRFVFYLDADERIPPGQAAILRHLLATQGHLFAAMALPFRNMFCGKELLCIYGYKAASIYVNGFFWYNARPHQGARIDGRLVHFPADDRELALLHLTYRDLSQHIQKMDGYTTTEAANRLADGWQYSWMEMLAHSARDMAMYEARGALRDGPHGLAWMLGSGYYRMAEWGKLWQKRYESGRVEPGESAVPASLEEALEFMLSVIRSDRQARISRAAVPGPTALPAATDVDSHPAIRNGVNGCPTRQRDARLARACFSGPLLDPSGIGEDIRALVFACDAAGVDASARSVSWGNDQRVLTGHRETRMQQMMAQDLHPGYILIHDNFPQAFVRDPGARVVVGRSMFEVDRPPQEYVRACNRMDYVWVPSEFNRLNYALAGVAGEKLVVMPGAFDAEPYRRLPARHSEALASKSSCFTFLTIFDWTLHKGWDVLLCAFLKAFGLANAVGATNDVRLIIKTWSTHGYSDEAIMDQAAQHISAAFGVDIRLDGRIQFRFDRLSSDEMLQLYSSADCFVLSSRCEGWGRPYMEAMAAGLPVIGTNWSGNTAFMNDANSSLIRFQLVDVPEVGWREIPPYRGARWAEPDADHLAELMRRIVGNYDDALVKASRGRDEVCREYCLEAVGMRIKAELERILDITGRPSASQVGANVFAVAQ